MPPSVTSATLLRRRVLPLRRTVPQQIELRYGSAVLANESMRADLFKVLADARARIAANADAVDARRDFDLAEIDVQVVLTYGGGAFRGSSAGAGTSMTP